MKKIHKNARRKSPIFGWQVRPVCKVDNRTLAYKASTNWREVTCEVCKRQETFNP